MIASRFANYYDDAFCYSIRQHKIDHNYLFIWRYREHMEKQMCHCMYIRRSLDLFRLGLEII